MRLLRTHILCAQSTCNRQFRLNLGIKQLLCETVAYSNYEYIFPQITVNHHDANRRTDANICVNISRKKKFRRQYYWTRQRTLKCKMGPE